ncbi:MAG: glycosyltransferase family 9 protein [Myxococcaceae bacterium]
MWPLKRLEGWAKRALALLAAALFYRPTRRLRAPAGLASARRVLLVRVDDRLGEALLLTPLLSALKAHVPPLHVDALVHTRCVRVLDGHPALDGLWALDRDALFLGPFAPGIRALRAKGPWDVVVDCGNWEVPSVTSALVSRLLSRRSVLVGPAVWPTRLLDDVPVPRRPETRSEVAQRLHLLAPLLGAVAQPALSFRTPRVPQTLQPLLAQLTAQPHAVLLPGGRLGWRRIPPDVFAAAARALAALGRRPVVAWGPGEEALARAVVQAAPEATLLPATDLDALAAVLAAAGCTICNNSGPLHLSVAVGAPTLGLFLKMDPARWGYSAPHRTVDLTLAFERGEPLAPLVAEASASFARTLPSSRAALADG